MRPTLVHGETSPLPRVPNPSLTESDTARALAAEVNPETIREQQMEIRELKVETFLLRKDRLRLAREVEALRAEKQNRALLAEAVTDWMLTDMESLVIDIEGEAPAYMHSLWESFNDDANARRLFAKAVSLAVVAGIFPRQFCHHCKEVSCVGCRREDAEIRIPQRVRNLLAEVRHA